MQVNPGLDGVIVADTGISFIDGQRGKLIYRGYEAKTLALHHSFEEVVYLLWKGKLPTKEEKEEWQQSWQQAQVLSEEIIQLIQLIPRQVEMLSVIRAALAAMTGDLKTSWPPTVEQGIQILTKVPMIIAARYRFLQGEGIVKPKSDHSFAANYLYMLKGHNPNTAHVRALDAYLILTAEHGFNASTFTSRVVTSTESILYQLSLLLLGH
jgi:citrate synthase